MEKYSDHLWATRRGAMLIVALYCLAHIGVHLFAWPVLAMDDAKENLFTQNWQWGYLPYNPPLYEWLLHLVQILTGPNLLSILIVKYGLLLASAALFWSLALRLYGDGAKASIATFGTVLLYQIGWNYHQAFTHSLVVVACAVAALWGFERLVRQGAWSDYLILGVIIGLGCLAKYNFAVLVIGLLAAGLSVAEIRAKILSVKMALALGLAGLMIAPHIVWISQNQALFAEYAQLKMGLTEKSWGAGVVAGLSKELVAVISFFLPSILALFLIFRPPLSRFNKPSRSSALLRVFARASLLCLALTALGVAAFGVEEVSERYVVPYLIPLYLWLMAFVFGSDKFARRQRLLLQVSLGWAGLVLVVRFATLAIAGPPLCDDCRNWLPYDGVNKYLEKNYPDNVTLIAYEENTAGNLRRGMPRADVRSLNLLFHNPISAPNGICVFVWSEEIVGAPLLPYFRTVADNNKTVMITNQWKHPFKDFSRRVSEWGVTETPQGTDFYQQFCMRKGGK